MSAHSLYENCENLQGYLLSTVYKEATETIYNLTFNSVNMLLQFHVAFYGRFSHVLDVKILLLNQVSLNLHFPGIVRFYTKAEGLNKTKTQAGCSDDFSHVHSI